MPDTITKVEPGESETQDEFIGRCMSALEGEFPDQDQRAAVCFDMWRNGKAPAQMSVKRFSTDLILEPGDRSFIATITAAVLDRDKEVLLPEGMLSKDYEKNPIIFWNHDHNQPIGKTTALRRFRDRWQAKGQLSERPADHPEGQPWFPDTVLHWMKEGIVRGVSVGFNPIKSRNPSKGDKDLFGEEVRRVHFQWDLLEFSITPLQANQDALITAVSKGLIERSRAQEIFGVEIPRRPERVRIEQPFDFGKPEPVKQKVTGKSIALIVAHGLDKAKGKIYASDG